MSKRVPKTIYRKLIILDTTVVCKSCATTISALKNVSCTHGNTNQTLKKNTAISTAKTHRILTTILSGNEVHTNLYINYLLRFVHNMLISFCHFAIKNTISNTIPRVKCYQVMLKGIPNLKLIQHAKQSCI